MKRIIERNLAEIIVISVVTIVLMSSCGSTYQAGPAYGRSVNPTYGSCSR